MIMTLLNFLAGHVVFHAPLFATACKMVYTVGKDLSRPFAASWSRGTNDCHTEEQETH